MDFNNLLSQLKAMPLRPSTVLYYETVDSTNTQARIYPDHIAPTAECALSSDGGALFIADGQTHGRGRLDRSFQSIKDAGLYMSIRINEKYVPSPTALTPTAAVAAANAISALCGATVGIKWVNDLYLSGKKLAGILCESHVDRDGRYYVVGIGINLRRVDRGPELREITTDLETEGYSVSCESLAARIYSELLSLLSSKESEVLRCYRLRSILEGRWVRVIGADGEFPALVLGVTDSFALRVFDKNENEILLSSGEVSLKFDNLN